MMETLLDNTLKFLALSFLAIRLQNVVLLKTGSRKYANGVFIFVNSILTLILIMNPFQYGDTTLNLRIVPIFLVVYLLGYKDGFLCGIIPISYLIFFKGANIVQEIIFLVISIILMQWIIFRSYKVQANKDIRIIDIRRILKSSIIFSIIRFPVSLFIVPMPVLDVIYLNLILITFTIIYLYFMSIVINDLNKKQIYKKNGIIAEKQLNSLANLCSDAVFVHIEDKIVYANPSALRLTGSKSLDELEGRSIFDFIKADEKDSVKKRMKILIHKKIPVPNQEHKIIGLDGEMRYVQITGCTIPYRNSVAILGIAKDITQQRTTERNLKSNQEKYWTLFNNLEDSVALINIDDRDQLFKLLEVNKKACEELGYSREELLNMTLHDVSLPELNNKVSKIISTIKNETNFKFESLAVRKNGDVFPVEVNVHYLKLDGRKVILAVHRDMTEYKNSQNAIKESERRYRTLVESSPDAVFVHQNGIIVYANEKAYQLLGYDNLCDIIGQSIWRFIHKSYVEVSKEKIDRALKENKTVESNEIKLINKEGISIDVEVSTTPIPFNGKSAIFNIVKDITERNRIQEDLKRALKHNGILLKKTIEYDKLKTDFFSNISHELKTPLNIILGCIQLMNIPEEKLEGCKECKNLIKYKKMMKQNCYRLLRLINNLIDITRMDTNYLKLDIKNYNIVNIVEDITISVAEYIKSKGINLIFDTEIEEKIIQCDADKIERIMLNLLSNAVKFTEENGSILVNIYDKNERLIIVVKDTGIGIPKEKLNTIFERFRQVDSLMTRKKEGSGIGLSLVEGLVKAHGGKISVYSKVGKGTEFIIDLPVRQSNTKSLENNEVATTSEENVERINIEFSDIYS